MLENKTLDFLKEVLNKMPQDWLNLTTHRLDIYNESRAKEEFLDLLDKMFNSGMVNESDLKELPTAYDYIRLGHPLSCVFEWAIANSLNLPDRNVISFDSKTIPLMAILRKNLMDNKRTVLYHFNALPPALDPDALKSVYNYQFDIKSIESVDEISSDDSVSILYNETNNSIHQDDLSKTDYIINAHGALGSILVICDEQDAKAASDIQHVEEEKQLL